MIWWLFGFWAFLAGVFVIGAMRFERHVHKLGRGRIADGSDPLPQGDPE